MEQASHGAGIVTAWWLFFWVAIGVCVGSFLNAVVYRLPRNHSLRSPLWSFCPYCRSRIRWYDNIPILSFVLLGGRCRDCHGPIATRYVVLEAVMALIVLMLLDAFFVGRIRAGLSDSQVGLTDRLIYDWPVLVAHVILFACLLSMSVIDLEHYWVDVRFTNFATVAGFVLHIVWMPKRGEAWMQPFDATAVMAVFALVGLGLTWIYMVCQPQVDAEDFGEYEHSPFDSEDDSTEREQRSRAPLRPPPRIAGWVAVALLLALIAGLYATESGPRTLNHTPRALLPLALLFVLIVSESTVSRRSDQLIIEAIEEERSGARAMVMRELAMLLPAAFFALVGLWVFRSVDSMASGISAGLHEPLVVAGLGSGAVWSPLGGLVTAASGFIIAGAIGWVVRIGFTLAFGKEAFGSGDIHLMAATGCIAGWPVVVIGFFLTCGLALVGWVLTLPFKRTRALPLGPWLSLSFLIVVIFYDRILTWPIVDNTIAAANVLFLNNSQAMPIGG